MLYEEFRAMNSAIVLAAEGDRKPVTIGFRLARQFIERSEARFTRFAESSELMQLNRSSGTWFQASPDLYEVVQVARSLGVETGGLFDPAILPALRQAGYDRSMDELLQSGPLDTHRGPQPKMYDFRMIQLDPASRSIYLPAGMQIDLGGIAKGWIAEKAALQLARFSTACAVSAGGDMFLIDLPAGQSTWEVGLEDPLDPTRDLELLHIGPGAIATSSVAKRRWVVDGQPQHHLIDPRTGRPAETDWLSVTVLAPHAWQAEGFAKALLIGGSQTAGFEFNNHFLFASLAVDRHGNLWGSPNSYEVLHVACQNFIP